VILVVDNYDSFTFNLVQLLASLGADVLVRRNDALTVAQALALAPSHIVLSPGPGNPHSAGISMALALASPVPLLGVCLGHQSLAAAHGARVGRAPSAIHGRASAILHDGAGIFSGLPQGLPVARYHSLAVDERTLPDALAVTARAEDGVVMAIAHRALPHVGVQFHPESVLTPDGPAIVRNFLESSCVVPP
jgi:anthranilate synthase component 2